MRYTVDFKPQGAIGHDVGLTIPLSKPVAGAGGEVTTTIVCADPYMVAVCPPVTNQSQTGMVAIAFSQPFDHDVTLTVSVPDTTYMAFQDPDSGTFVLSSIEVIMPASQVGIGVPYLAAVPTDEVVITVSADEAILGTTTCATQIVCEGEIQAIWMSAYSWAKNSPGFGAAYYDDGNGPDAAADRIDALLPSSAVTPKYLAIVLEMKVEFSHICPGDVITWDTAGSTTSGFVSVFYPFPAAGSVGVGNANVAIAQLVFPEGFSGAPAFNDGETLVLNAYLNGDAITGVRRSQFTWTFSDSF